MSRPKESLAAPENSERISELTDFKAPYASAHGESSFHVSSDLALGHSHALLLIAGLPFLRPILPGRLRDLAQPAFNTAQDAPRLVTRSTRRAVAHCGQGGTALRTENRRTVLRTTIVKECSAAG
jgi:hypothetical protein